MEMVIPWYSAIIGLALAIVLILMKLNPINAAIMVHTGAVVIDHLPHGTYFHVSADAVDMSFADRMKCIGYESIIGLSIATVAIIIYGIL